MAPSLGCNIFESGAILHNNAVFRCYTILLFHMFLPSTTKLPQGNIFTGICQSFCSLEGGCLSQCMLGYIPQADTSPGRHPSRQTPPRQTHPRQTHPQADHPWRSLQRTVCILLECILVQCFFSNKSVSEHLTWIGLAFWYGDLEEKFN